MMPLLFYLAVIFCSGIIFAAKIKFIFFAGLLAAAGFIIFSYLCINREKFFYLFVSLAVFLLGALSFTSSRVVYKGNISNFIDYKDDNLYVLKGVVVSPPDQEQNHTTFILKAEEITQQQVKYSISGNVRVVYSQEENFSFGDELILLGKLHKPFGKRKEYFFRQGIFGILQVDAPADNIGISKALFLQRFSNYLKTKIEQKLFKYLTGVTAGIMDAMLLGEKKFVPLLLNNTMVLTGTVHILVVSGFNVGIVAMLLLLLFKFLRFKRNVRYFIVIFCLIVYCFLTGASTPVVRATIMAIFFLAGFILKREPNIYNSLGLAALVILAVNPAQVFDLGFQLSFASVLAIVFLYPKLKSLLRVELVNFRPLKFMIEGLLVSLAAWIGTVGIIACNFKIISLVTVLANIFIVPLATLITLCGFSLVFLGFIYPPFAYLVASTSEFIVMVLVKINLLMAQLPFSCLFLS
ncbi:MAG: ComEC family competence protein [Candidatus Omnitrophica bacterium]|nr:ComEC family competence protein [Candidatus Omnitrophota bacterium]